MNKKCICGNEFTAKKEEIEFCSAKCHHIYIQSDEFDMEIEKTLGINSEEWIIHQLKQSLRKMDVSTRQYQEFSSKLMDKVGYATYDSIINSMMKRNEEGDYI